MTPSSSQPSILPNFRSLRERNLLTLYGTTADGTINLDKSPKGSVDEKIRPLVDLINRNEDYVTLSSCSGRVALFDPTGGGYGCDEIRDETELLLVESANDNEQEWKNAAIDDIATVSRSGQHPPSMNKKEKSTKISGKGRGKWIFVTHDILPDLGQQMIRSLRDVGRERLEMRRRRRLDLQTQQIKANPRNTNEEDCINFDESPITFKHEPPLLHVAASSLESGKKLLHLAKSICAMRESGLVVTDQRVTVELRTTGTLLCMPLMVQLQDGAEDSSSGNPSVIEKDETKVSLMPNEQYLKNLAELANERMRQNEILLDRLYKGFENFCIGQKNIMTFDKVKKNTNVKVDAIDASENDYEFDVILRPLPPLNLWKTAAVAIPTGKNGDVDVISFGGQGTGPDMSCSTGKTPPCRRWDTVFRLANRDGNWSDKWDTLPIRNNENNKKDDLIGLTTNSGRFRVKTVRGIGSREGHTACILPSLTSKNVNDSDIDAVVIFGGRTGGPLALSNDLFLFVLDTEKQDSEGGVMAIPVDIRGRPPEPRFGHSMTPFGNFSALTTGNEDHLAIVAGGIGVASDMLSLEGKHSSSQMDCGASVTFSTVFVLSRLLEKECGFHHLQWSSLSEMPSPRAYHSAVILPEAFSCDNGSESLIVFGGVTESNDPLCPSETTTSQTWFEHPIFNDSGSECQSGDKNSNLRVAPLIGASAAIFPIHHASNTVSVMLSGGVHVAEQYVNRKPLDVFIWSVDEQKMPLGPKRGRVSSTILKGQCDDPESSNAVDFGSCVHHCLVALPQQVLNNGEITAVLIGGGVPSFSFGQAYAKSYSIELKPKCFHFSGISQTPSVLDRAKTTKTITASKQQGKVNVAVEADVLCVASRFAKKVKTELERLGYLDKRYKMVKVSGHPTGENDAANSSTDNMIALPVTENCIANLDEVRKQIFYSVADGDATNLPIVVEVKRETVPLSSSSVGKMKQSR
ncbi:hypothetical protein ACHAXS_007475 [Conticribra weissflogii]